LFCLIPPRVLIGVLGEFVCSFPKNGDSGVLDKLGVLLSLTDA